MGRRRTVQPARCVEHPGGHTVSMGTFDTQAGRKRRYKCTPPAGDVHTFSVAIDGDGQLTGAWSPPPACPEHAGSKVVRNGTYGKTTAKPRQRYLCTPDGGGDQHTFTPDLARDHVHEAGEQCDVCDELRGVHHGETAVATTHSWNTRLVAQGLERLSRGESYASVSRWARRVTDTDKVRTRRSPPAKTSKSRKSKRRRAASRLRRNAWHTAADWTELLSPVVFAPVEQQLRQQALDHRARNDALLDAGEPLADPQVLLVDDKPIYGRTLDGNARRDEGFYLLIAAEQFTDNSGVSRPKLRLVRAMAKSNNAAWRLLFDELGYAPDFIIADAGTGIQLAIDKHFDPTRTRLVPSLHHVGNKITEALWDATGATTDTSRGKELIAPIAAHLRLLSRDSGVLDDEASWTGWWDELEDMVKAHGLPLDGVVRRRDNYEDPVANVLDAIAAHPQLRLTTGGLETLIEWQVEPLLAGRRHAFGNIRRTNRLFDLVVARDHHAFDNIADVARLLRDDMLAHDGYAPPLRHVADPKRGDAYYSSLRDEQLLQRLAERKKLT